MAPPVDPALLEDVVDIVRRAGELTLQWFGRPDLRVDVKGDGSPVTEADRATERFLREELSARFPDDAIVGEEEPDRRGTSARTWTLDPIDGTKAFTRGVPLYANLLALDDEHGPAIGIINIPALREVVAAGRGIGCFHNGSRCAVSSTSRLADAYGSTSGLDAWPPDMLQRVLATPLKLRTWGDGYGYVLVATGRIDAMIDPVVAPYDVAPMRVVIPEAGGRFSDLHGVDRADGGSGLATNGRLHDELLAVLQGRA
ncbi:MAG TPA: inositol monophosphatase family protein [Acidimicrobiales bacterium]